MATHPSGRRQTRSDLGVLTARGRSSRIGIALRQVRSSFSVAYAPGQRAKGTSCCAEAVKVSTLRRRSKQARLVWGRAPLLPRLRGLLGIKRTSDAARRQDPRRRLTRFRGVSRCWRPGVVGRALSKDGSTYCSSRADRRSPWRYRWQIRLPSAHRVHPEIPVAG